jgi:hypothetical protein
MTIDYSGEAFRIMARCFEVHFEGYGLQTGCACERRPPQKVECEWIIV